jgi:hypothetical protein
MKRFALIILTAFFAQPALAFHCPADIAKIDAALAAGPNISAAQLANVQEYRASGEKLHKSGNHPDSVAILQEAMDILGIK